MTTRRRANHRSEQSREAPVSRSQSRSAAGTDWRTVIEDPTRLTHLFRCGLLDSAAEESFDRLTRLCADLLRAPVALVSLVDDHRQFFKSALGLCEPWASRRETPLSHSFCKHGVAMNAPLVVSDARLHPDLQDNLAIRDLGAIAYAGIPLRSSGFPIGMFCVIDGQPREWSEQELKLLTELAHAVETQLELRLTNSLLDERGRMLEQLLQTMPTGVVVRNSEGRVLRTNPALERVLGYSRTELEAADAVAITHPDDRPADALNRAALDNGNQPTAEVTQRLLHKDGHWVWTRMSSAAVRDETGKLNGTIALIEDISAQREAQRELAHQAEVYRAIARSIPRGAVFMCDHDLRILAADGPEVLASIGIDRDELMGKTLDQIVSHEAFTSLAPYYRRALSGETVEREVVRNGRSLLTRFAPVRRGAGIAAAVALTLDVTEERVQTEAVRYSKALFEATMATIEDGVVLLDENNTVLLANAAYADFFGFELERLPGTGRARFLAQISRLSDDPEDLVRRIETPSGAGDEFVFARPRKRILRRTVTSVALPNGPGQLVTWHDATVQVELMAERRREAFTDPLTGIPNRRAAEDTLRHEQARVQRAGSRLSVALFDIDHFKSVNDRFGHAAGDEVLRRVAETLHGRRD